MSYNEAAREAALDCLAANEGDFRLTSQQTGITAKTLRRWARQAQVRGDEMQALRTSLEAFEERLAVERESLAEEADVGGWLFSELPLQLARDAVRLSESMAEVIADAPLNQRMSALSQCVDMILKLRKAMPEIGEEGFKVVFIDPEDGTAHPAPYWASDDFTP